MVTASRSCRPCQGPRQACPSVLLQATRLSAGPGGAHQSKPEARLALSPVSCSSPSTPIIQRTVQEKGNKKKKSGPKFCSNSSVMQWQECVCFPSQEFSGRWGFSPGPVGKNPPCNAGDSSSIPGRGTKTPHGQVQLSPSAPAPEPVLSRASPRQKLSPGAAAGERSLPATAKSLPSGAKDLVCGKGGPEGCNQDPRQPDRRMKLYKPHSIQRKRMQQKVTLLLEQGVPMSDSSSRS